jgi:hypothetical protein
MKSSQIFQQASHWIQECEHQHQSCHKYEASAPLPTRLVAVQRTLTGLSARLCDSQLLPSGTKYITLSHCWGSFKFLTLREDNKDAFQKSIPIPELTRTSRMLFTLLFNWDLHTSGSTVSALYRTPRTWRIGNLRPGGCVKYTKMRRAI